jgi:type I restriction enzyme, S subunit
MPIGWTTFQLEDCCDIVRGVSFPSQAKNFTPTADSIACLRTTNVQKEVEWNNLWFIPREYVRREEQIVKQLDILISLANSYELVGKTALVREIPISSTLGAFISAIRCRQPVNSKFIFYQLTSPLKVAELRDLASTTTNISNISTAKLARLDLSLAPTREQERLVAKLEELLSDLEAAVGALERARANLKRYRAAVLKAAVEGKLTAEWRKANPNVEPADKLLERILVERRRKWEEAQLAKYAAQGKQPPKGWKAKFIEARRPDITQLGVLPRNWCWTTLEQVVARSEYGTSVKCDYDASGTPVLRIPNIKNGIIDLTDLKFSLTKLELTRGDELQPGDLLMCRTNGSIRLVGKSAVIRTLDGRAFAFASYLLRFRFIEISLLPEWVDLYVNAQPGRAFVETNAASSAGQHNISLATLLRMPIPVPPVEELAELEQRVAEALSRIDKAEREVDLQLERASRLRQAILKRAFEGKLVPQDPNDEPASVLLERIRAARASDASSAKPARVRKDKRPRGERAADSTGSKTRAKKKPAKRSLFAELMEGFDALKRQRNG